MGSITQSPDRIAQVVSETAAPINPGDTVIQPAHSNPLQVVEQTVTGISTGEIVYESKQQCSSFSEGVASAGHPSLADVDRMDEFVPAATDAPISAVAAYEGETSGGNDVTGGSNGYGDLTDANLAPPTTTIPLPRHRLHHHQQQQTSVQLPTPHQRTDHILTNTPMDFQATESALHPQQHSNHISGKRKSYTDGTDMLEPKRAEGLNRVPSDLALVMGLSDGEGIDPIHETLGDNNINNNHNNNFFTRHHDHHRHHDHMMDACDSNVAGILAGVAGAAPTLGDIGISRGVEEEEANQSIDFNTLNDIDRPSDADIIDWQNKIREENSRNIPLVGDIEPLGSLEAEYRSGNDVFIGKIAAIREGYSSIRRTRGDGNCFFRSFIFGYLEHMVQTKNVAERDAAVTRLLALKQTLADAGYDDLVIDAPLDLLLGMLRSIEAPTDTLTLSTLESNLRAEDISNYIVFLLRMITAAEVKRRSEFFAPFIMNMGVDGFCSRCIDPMGEESDHVQLVALTDALKVPVRVVYMDRSSAGDATASMVHGGSIIIEEREAILGEGDGGSVSVAGATSGVGAGSTVNTVASAMTAVKVDVHDFMPERDGDEDGDGGKEPIVHLLYRPGHYDMLYLKTS